MGKIRYINTGGDSMDSKPVHLTGQAHVLAEAHVRAAGTVIHNDPPDDEEGPGWRDRLFRMAGEELPKALLRAGVREGWDKIAPWIGDLFFRLRGRPRAIGQVGHP